MLPIVPRSETRFWRIFRWLLFPLGAISLVFCIVMALMAGLGGNAPVANGREPRGLEGVLKIMAAFPILTVLLTLITSFAIYFERLKSKWRK